MKKNYREIAKTWVSGRYGKSSTTADLTDLAALLEAAYEDGRADSFPVLNGAESTPRRTTPSRKEEQAIQRTLRVLGPDCTLAELKQIPHKRRAVAAHAGVEVDMLRDFLEDQPLGIASRTMILKSLRDLGFAEVMPRAGEPGSPGDQVVKGAGGEESSSRVEKQATSRVEKLSR